MNPKFFPWLFLDSIRIIATLKADGHIHCKFLFSNVTDLNSKDCSLVSDQRIAYKMNTEEIR